MAITISGSGITSANIADGTIVNADINSSAAIDGTKVDGSFGKVLQVVSTHFNTSYSNSSATPQSVSDFAVTITPSKATSKILVFVSISASNNNSYSYSLLKRNGTSIFTSNIATSSAVNSFLAFGNGSSSEYQTASKTVLDEPASTSAQTYQVWFAGAPYGSNTAYINRLHVGTTNTYQSTTCSTITAMEIGA